MKKLLFVFISIVICQTLFSQFKEGSSGDPTISSEIYKLSNEQLFDSKYEVFKEKGKFGIREKESKTLILKADFESINKELNIDHVFVLGSLGRKGLYNLKENKIFIPIAYDEIKILIEEFDFNSKRETRSKQIFFKVKKDNKYGLYNQNSELIIPVEYDEINEQIYGGFFRLRKDKLYGIKFIDKLKKDIPCVFYSVASNTFSFVCTSANGGFDLYDENGELYFTKCYNFKGVAFSNNNKGKKIIIIEKSNNTFGVIDITTKKIILPFEYGAIDGKFGSLFIVNKNGKHGVVDYENSILIPFDYDEISTFDPMLEDFLLAKRTNTSDIFEKNGKLLFTNLTSVKQFKYIKTEEQFSSLDRFEIYLVTNLDGKQALFNSKDGKQIFQFEYDKIFNSFSDNYIVKNETKFGAVTQDNKIIIPFKYDSISFIDFNPRNLNFKYLVKSKENYGIIDKNGKVLIDVKYKQLENINKFYKVKSKEQFYIINSKGEKLSSKTYDNIGWFYQNKCAVFYKNKIAYIDTLGNIIKGSEKLSQARGFKNYEEIYLKLIDVLKSENDSLLLEFCKDIAYDEYSYELLKRIEGRESRRGQLGDVQKIYNSYRDFRKRLKSNNELHELSVKSVHNAQISPYSIGYEGNYVPKLSVKIYLKTEKRDYNLDLFSVINLDGYWKVLSGNLY